MKDNKKPLMIQSFSLYFPTVHIICATVSND